MTQKERENSNKDKSKDSIRKLKKRDKRINNLFKEKDLRREIKKKKRKLKKKRTMSLWMKRNLKR
jgi:hypothetical protein